MKLASLLHESIANIVSGSSRTFFTALLFALVAVGPALADLTTTRAIISAAERFQAAAGSISTIEAPGRIDGNTCAALAEVPGVRAAGAYRNAEQGVTALALPSSPIPAKETTPGFERLLRPTGTPGAGPVLSDQAARVLGIGDDDRLQTTSGAVRISGTYSYPEDGRRSGFGYAMLLPSHNSDPFDECWIDVWPASPSTSALLHLTVVQSTGESQPPRVSQLNTTLGATFDGHARFLERTTRFAPALGFVLSLGTGYFWIRSRRLQLASALHAGVRRRDLNAGLGIEALSWLLPVALLAASTIALLVSTAPAIDREGLISTGIADVSTAILGAVTGTLLGVLHVRERSLFRYFTDR